MRKWLLFLGFIALILLIDQLSKQWIITHLNMGETVLIHPALYPYLQITRSANTGIAFGIGSGGSEIVLVLSLGITLALLVVFWNSRKDAYVQHIALGMVLGGAVGNIIDRIQYGHVVDFVHIVIPGLISNVSNFADHAIVIGAIMLMIESFLSERREKAEQEAAVPNPADSA